MIIISLGLELLVEISIPGRVRPFSVICTVLLNDYYLQLQTNYHLLQELINHIPILSSV